MANYLFVSILIILSYSAYAKDNCDVLKREAYKLDRNNWRPEYAKNRDGLRLRYVRAGCGKEEQGSLKECTGVIKDMNTNDAKYMNGQIDLQKWKRHKDKLNIRYSKSYCTISTVTNETCDGLTLQAVDVDNDLSNSKITEKQWHEKRAPLAASYQENACDVNTEEKREPFAEDPKLPLAQ